MRRDWRKYEYVSRLASSNTSSVSASSIEEKLEYITYLVGYHLVDNEEVAKTMKYHLFGPPQYSLLFEGIAEQPKDRQEVFYKTALEKMIVTTSLQQIAQKAFGAASREELAQKVLGASSPFEAALKLVKSEAALLSEEERRQLLALLLQDNHHTEEE